MVHQAAVVPDQHVASSPRVLPCEAILRRVRPQRVEQRFRFVERMRWGFGRFLVFKDWLWGSNVPRPLATNRQWRGQASVDAKIEVEGGPAII